MKIQDVYGDVARLSSVESTPIEVYGRVFRGEDFSGISLKRINFIRCTFEGVNFRGANMKHLYFENCSLMECDFSEAQLTHCGLNGTSMKGVDFSKGSFTNSVIQPLYDEDSGELVGEFYLEDVNFSGCDFRNTTVNGGGYVRRINLDGAQVTRDGSDGLQSEYKDEVTGTPIMFDLESVK